MLLPILTYVGRYQNHRCLTSLMPRVPPVLWLMWRYLADVRGGFVFRFFKCGCRALWSINTHALLLSLLPPPLPYPVSRHSWRLTTPLMST